jgi:hypothetical protein
VRGLAEEFGGREFLALREMIQPYIFGSGEGAEARGAIAVGPLHVVSPLARGFHQIAEKKRIVFGWIHRPQLGAALTHVKPHPKAESTAPLRALERCIRGSTTLFALGRRRN